MKFKLLIALVTVAIQTSVFAQYSVQMPYKDVSVVSKNGKIVFNGASLMSTSGQPQLPHYTVSFMLPPSTDFKSVKVSFENLETKILDEKYDVLPAPPYVSSERKVVWPKGRTIVDGKDVQVYQSNSFSPSSHLGKISFGKMRQYNMADVEVFPYLYNPVTGKLQVITGGKLVVTVSESAAKATTSKAVLKSQSTAADRELSPFEKNLKKKVINFDVKSEYDTQSYNASSTSGTSTATSTSTASSSTTYASAASVVSGRYVIITTSAIVSASTQLSNFVTAKQTKGYTVQVVTESQWGGGTGDAAADNIRNWLQQNYLSLNITNVLLIGNPNPSTGDVPMKMCYPRSEYTSDYEAPSDYFFAELSGNWDMDGDGVDGEFDDYSLSGGPDQMAEVAVGRIPYYGTITELDKILAKTIAYGNQTDKNWRRKALLASEPLDEGTSGVEFLEAVKNDILIPQGIDFYRIADTAYSSTGAVFSYVTSLNPPLELTPCTESNVSTNWANNEYGLVVWSTHGNSTGASEIMSSSNAYLLNDNRSSFTFQVSCTNGEPETTDNLGYALLANGAIGTVSASRVSWYVGGQTVFEGAETNASLAYYYTRNLVSNKLNAGDALCSMRADMPMNNCFSWMNCLDFNLYGSPDEALELPLPVYLSNLPLTSSQNGWGPIERDMSNGDTGAGDGVPLGLGNMQFSKGLGCHAASEAVFNLGSQYTTFNSWLGVDNESGSAGSVKFSVYADGSSIYTSDTLTGNGTPERISLDITNVNTLRLVVTDNGDGTSDHADWAGAHLLGTSGTTAAYTLRVFTNGSGNVTINPFKASYSEGEIVTLTANPLSGAQFTQWSGNGSGTDSSITVTMNSNKAITAAFESVATIDSTRMELESFSSVSGYSSLTTGTKGPAASEYSGSAGKYSGGSGVRACQSSFAGTSGTYNVSFRWYDKSTSVTTSYYTLVVTNGSTAVLNSTWYADKSTVGWYNQTFSNIQIDNGATITVYASRASSNDPVIMDYIDFIPTGSGTVAPSFSLTKNISGDGIILTNPAGSVFDSAAVVSLTAVPSTGVYFSSWSGDLSGSVNPQNLTMNSNKNVTATFSSGTTYSVTYNSNGSTSGSVPTDANAYASGATVTALGNTGSLVKTGYTFAGWNTNASGTGTSYAAGSTFTISASTTLYARWTATATYSVTYNSNGSTSGLVPTDANAYASGATVTVLGNTGSLVKTGYTFAGWNTNTSGTGTSYAAGSTFTISASTTLYARWTASTSQTIEAENTTYCSWSGGAVETEHTGYSGTGYVNVTNASSAWIQCNVTVAAAGTCTITVRYANGGTSVRTSSLIVNGTTITTGAFAATGAWTTYSTQTFTGVSLNAGSNTIRLTATTSGGPANIDQFVIAQ